MPWKENSPMDERRHFIEEFQRRETTVTALAKAYGISRKTAYKWITRCRLHGEEGFVEGSRAPRYRPNTTAAWKEMRIVALRRRYRHWGPRKLSWWLREHEGGAVWPAPSTIGSILERNGLIQPRRRRRKWQPSGWPQTEMKEVNAVWAADFKGWFRTADGERIDPLTITDTASRYLLVCEGARKTGLEEVKPIFEAAFRENGLPEAIRTDNGPPFASRSLGGISRLSVWWMRLGIKPDRIKPGHPEQNGRHERMHKTLKAETAKPPRKNAGEQQRAFNEFRREYNDERPHEAIGMQPPARLYRTSPREYLVRLPELEYDREHEIRSVRPNGCIKWRGEMVFVSQVLSGERIGLKPVDDQLWSLCFGPYRLGTLDSATGKINDYTREKVSPMSPDQSVTHVPA